MIAVLPPDLSEEQLVPVRALLAERGWRCEESRGSEQLLLAVAGPATEAELEAALASHVQADVLPLRERRQYERERRVTRIMHGLVAGLATLVALGLGVPAVWFLRAPEAAVSASDPRYLVSLDRLPVHGAQIVRVDEQPVLVIRMGERRVFALSAICTHMADCQLEWSEERLQITCPCHGGVYDVYGNVVEGPPSIPLRSYEIELTGSDVRIRRNA